MSEEKVNVFAELIEKGREKGSLSEKEIERVFGEGSCTVLKVRKDGAIKVL